MEEWHQKLHNNTTPDDVPICEAYVAFLRGDGDNGAYWRVLSDAGVTRNRCAPCLCNLLMLLMRSHGEWRVVTRALQRGPHAQPGRTVIHVELPCLET
jgi:hypothetical protein